LEQSFESPKQLPEREGDNVMDITQGAMR